MLIDWFYVHLLVSSLKCSATYKGRQPMSSAWEYFYETESEQTVGKSVKKSCAGKMQTLWTYSK